MSLKLSAGFVIARGTPSCLAIMRAVELDPICHLRIICSGLMSTPVTDLRVLSKDPRVNIMETSHNPLII